MRDALAGHAQAGGRYSLLETAGGILSPAPSGTLQADLYRPLRLPATLVGDHRLGGISSTISAFESLHVRGYNVDSVILFEDLRWGNFKYLRNHFKPHGIQAFAFPAPPSPQEIAKDDELAMAEYYDRAASDISVNAVIDLIQEKHQSRISKISAMPALAESVIWHPFRQHGLPQDIIAIDSAYGDHFQAHITPPSVTSSDSRLAPISALSSISPQSRSEAVLTPLFDGSASWWTQGLGHGNPDLSLTAAHAAGRYGHVMFANAVHEPALDLSYNLLSSLANPRLSRVFFTDNGSTGMEVAVKMALRASSARYGLTKGDGELEILGLKGSYHGDTIGVMNCSEPSPYNEKVDWYRPGGFWLDPPQLKMRQGLWELEVPDEASEELNLNGRKFQQLEDIFDFQARDSAGHSHAYRIMIEQTLNRLVKVEGRRFGALILEPVVMGAGGMIFVDPLFQRALIKVVRENARLFESVGLGQQDSKHLGQESWTSWSGLPVIADEVFTGLYRLGRASSSSFLSANPRSEIVDADAAPDISVHAKLLTGGLLPLAITTASESVFNAFLSDQKPDALLHGHSYTAHAIGCSVADMSLKELDAMNVKGTWDDFRSSWQLETNAAQGQSSSHPVTLLGRPEVWSPPAFWSFWSPATTKKLSHSVQVDGVWTLGCVLAITMRTADPAGYTSNAAVDLQATLLLDGGEEGAGVHSRVLGNVLYLMTSLTTRKTIVEQIETRLCRALC